MIKNTSERKYAEDRFILDFIDKPCADVQCTMSDYDESIEECRGMIEYNQEIGDKNEVRFWRQQLQKIKTEKRITQRLIENKTNSEVATI